MTKTCRQIEDLKQVIPDSVTRSLVEAFPGVVLYIPKRLRDEHPITAIGFKAAEILSKHFGGDTIYVPRSYLTSRERRDRIKAWRETHRKAANDTTDEFKMVTDPISIVNLALDVGLTERRVYQVLAELEDEELKND